MSSQRAQCSLTHKHDHTQMLGKTLVFILCCSRTETIESFVRAYCVEKCRLLTAIVESFLSTDEPRTAADLLGGTLSDHNRFQLNENHEVAHDERCQLETPIEIRARSFSNLPISLISYAVLIEFSNFCWVKSRTYSYEYAQVKLEHPECFRGMRDFQQRGFEDLNRSLG